MQNHDLEQRIRERAFQIWIEEGQPEGRDKNHWEQAEHELVSGISPPLQPTASEQQDPSHEVGKDLAIPRE